MDPCPLGTGRASRHEPCRRSRDVALDIGANIGVHSVLLSALLGPRGRLFIFEPDTELIRGLRRTALGLGNASVLPYALSDRRVSAPCSFQPMR